MNPEVTMSFSLPPALMARLEQAAQDDETSPVELVESLLDRYQRDRSWQELVKRGLQRGAARGLASSADEEAVNDLVEAKIAESRSEQRGQ